MDLLEVLSNYGAMGVFVILVWILIQQVLNEDNQNRDLYKTSVEEFHKTVNEFSLTIKEISIIIVSIICGFVVSLGTLSSFYTGRLHFSIGSMLGFALIILLTLFTTFNDLSR